MAPPVRRRSRSEAAPPSFRASAERKKKALRNGFTLLEVLVAIAILGLGLTVILSSQTGLFSSASRGAHLTAASNLLRCKMSEIELNLEQQGFSLTDENDEGECCEDEEGYSCAWKIERIELPPLPEAAPLDGDAGIEDPGGAGPLGALASISASQGASLGENPTPASVMDQLGSTGTSGMEGMVMGFVYPSLKPMLEASIRKVTVKVTWKEGQRERELEATQYLTRPQEGELATAEQIGLDQLSSNPALSGTTDTGTNTGTGTGTNTSTSTGTNAGRKR